MNEKNIAEILEKAAARITPEAGFQAELEKQLKDVHKPNERFVMFKNNTLFPTLGIIGGLAILLLALNWAFHSLAPKTIPGADGTPLPTQLLEGSPTPQATPNAKSYDWHGTKLYLKAPLPDTPAQANIYIAQAYPPATMDNVHALAAQFGMSGQIYAAPPELGGSSANDYLVVDGNQRLQVRSDQYFAYYPDYPKYTQSSYKPGSPSNATQLIDGFMQAHSFAYPYRIEKSEMYGGWYVTPLTPDGFPIHYEFFNASGFLFTFDNSEIISVNASLMKYTQAGGAYQIRTAQDALQMLLGTNTGLYGTLGGSHSATRPIKGWSRVHPPNQTVTTYGWMSSSKSFDGSAPLVTFDGYTTTGNLSDITAPLANTFVEVTGQFQVVDGLDTFKIESWKIYDGHEDSLTGTIQRIGLDVVIETPDRGSFTLPDIPADFPLPMENAFVVGVAQGNIFEWNSIDDRFQNGGAGGGGGSNGSGFYKLNLTGTPVPLPTVEPIPQPVGGGGGIGVTYTVQAGDTLGKIASENGVSVDTLMKGNGLADTVIFVGQTLVIPGTIAQPTIGQKIENLRGMIYINIFKGSDGSQRTQYGFSTKDAQLPFISLEGADPQNLQNNNGRPADIWGTVDRFEHDGTPVVMVDRMEIPFPGLKFQILRGTQKSVEIQGQSVILFTAEDGTSYVQAAPDGTPDNLLTAGVQGDQILLETLAIPGDNFGGYSTIRAFSAAMAINPKNGQPMEMQITADQPQVIDQSQTQPPAHIDSTTLTIEKVELVYYVPDQRNLTPNAGAEPVYIQPAWHFYGHNSNGDEFEFLVQALKDEFLLPELAPYTPPG